jgi:hypothetical protein
MQGRLCNAKSLWASLLQMRRACVTIWGDKWPRLRFGNFGMTLKSRI